MAFEFDEIETTIAKMRRKHAYDEIITYCKEKLSQLSGNEYETDTQRVRLLNEISMDYGILDDHKKALTYALKAHKITRSSDFSRMDLHFSFLMLARKYDSLGDTTKQQEALWNSVFCLMDSRAHSVITGSLLDLNVLYQSQPDISAQEITSLLLGINKKVRRVRKK